MNDRTIARLTKALTPLIDQRRHHVDGRTGATIWACGAEMHDIDLRDVGPEGVTRFWISGGEVIPWAEIRRIETFEIGRRRGQPIRRRSRYLRP